jgi:hypothetical protein
LIFWGARVKVFFFGVGYCAEALIRRMPRIDASGTARSEGRVAELRARGVDAHLFDGASAGPGLGPALERAEAGFVSIPPATFRLGQMNGRKARESGLWLKAWIAQHIRARR